MFRRIYTTIFVFECTKSNSTTKKHSFLKDIQKLKGTFEIRRVK